MATVSSLSLESYLQLRQALTKGQSAVKPVQQFEEAFYKPNDLKQVLTLHGIPFNSRAGRGELLQALVGHELVSLVHQGLPPSNSLQHVPHAQPGTPHDQQQQQPPVTPQDLVNLGWASSSSMQDLEAAFQDPQNLFVPAVNLSRPTAVPPELVVQPSTHQSLLQEGSPEATLQRQRQQQQQQYCGSGGLDAAQPTSPMTAVAAVATTIPAHVPSQPATAAVTNPGVAAVPVSSARLEAAPTTAPTAAVPAASGSDPRDALLAQLLQQQAATQQLLAQLLPANPAPPSKPASHTGDMSKDPVELTSDHTAAAAGGLQQGSGSYLPAAVGAGVVCLHPPGGSQQGHSGATAGGQVQDVATLQQQAIHTHQQAPDGEAAVPPLPAAASPLHAWLHQQVLLLVQAGAAPCRQTCSEPAHYPSTAAAGSTSVSHTAPGAVGSSSSSCGSGDDPRELLGRRVAFALLEELEVLGPKGLKLQQLPAGLYQSRVVRYLGPACLPDLCEVDCPGGHQFFKVKVLPTAAQLSSGAGPVAAAAGGRPVELQVDLAARHRMQDWAQLLQLEEQALQDGWVLLQAASEVQDPGASGKRGPEGSAGVAACSNSSKRNRQQ